MKYLYKFKFNNGEIYEIKYPNIIQLRSERYKWYIKLNGLEYPLEFISSNFNTRKLKLGEIIINLDIEKLIMSMSSVDYKLTSL